MAVFLDLFRFFAHASPLGLIYLRGPLHFVDAVNYKNELLYFHIDVLYFGIFLYYLYLQCFIVFKFSFRYKT